MSPAQLPPHLAQRALAALGRPPAPSTTPKDAATVVLLRDTAAGPEAYLLRRVASMAFAAGMYVFPGGTVDPRDADTGVPWAGPAPQEWAARLSADASVTPALLCAAVRETFEESGILLAGPDAGSVVGDTTDESWEDDRRALLDRRLAFSQLLTRRGLVLRADLLRLWAHWITPDFEERRYDTRFFVAALPVGQRTRDVGGEADRVVWVRPADAVEAFREGRLALLPPTLATLEELSAYPTVGDALAAGDERPIPTVRPRPVLTDDGVRLLLPGDPGYEG